MHMSFIYLKTVVLNTGISQSNIQSKLYGMIKVMLDVLHYTFKCAIMLLTKGTFIPLLMVINDSTIIIWQVFKQSYVMQLKKILIT